MITQISWRRFIINLVRILQAIVGFFLVARIVFLAIPANSATPFVAWVYQVSSNLMSPFRAIVQNTATGTGGVFDWVAVITLVAYLILGEILISIANSLLPLEEERYIGGEARTYHSIRRR